MSAVELSRGIAAGEISPVDVVEAVLKRVRECNPKINAVVTLLEEEARREAERVEEEAKRGVRRPMFGVPVTIKDNILTKGVRTTFGSKMFENFVPKEDAILVERLKEAGAIILGKTNLPEFALIPITDNLLFGATRNPWDLERTPGGSSGGAAAAVASGICPVAIGNDGGGSIRIPSALCGVYGFKPSLGRVPSCHDIPVFLDMVSNGPITRTVADAALVMDVISGPDERDRLSLPAVGFSYLERLDEGVEGKRFAYSPNLGYATVEPEVEELTRRAASSFEKSGAEVEEVKVDIPNLEGEMVTLVVAEVVAMIGDRLEEWKSVAYPLYLSFLPLADTLSFRDYIKVRVRREELWDSVRKIFEKYDFLLTPTTAVPAFKLEEGMGPTEIAGTPVGPLGWMPFTYPFNFTGQPAASIPCGFTKNGLPVGLQIVGRRHDDLGVLQASRAFEKVNPWRDKKPPL
ncbi:MAG: amidase [Candidatus Freyarchaeota archaeon]|nr:amidase [Candidatus Jordarchaeia archaeon]